MTALLVNGQTWLVTGVGFGMVIILLIVLIFILQGLGAVVSNITAPKAPKAAAKAAPAVQAPAVKAGKESDEMPVAAIAMALHLYFNGVHDEEPTQITIKNVERRYSPWNSKLYGMNNLHR